MKWGGKLALLLALWWPLQALAALNVVYPAIEERAEDSYGFKVLKLALDKSGTPYRLTLSPDKMNQERARVALENGSISIFDTGTSREFEQRFKAVYFPIDRGLSGYRLFIINQKLAPQFAVVKTLGDLRKHSAGQGPGWADSRILAHAGIPVQTAEFSSLFRMVDLMRFDFYPLGAEEIFGLFDRFQAIAPNSMIEPTLALHYPFGRLFFVRKNNKALHDAVQAGLEKAFADGSLQALLESDELFKSVARADLPHRTIIELDNPNLSVRFRSMPARYFYQAGLQQAAKP